MPKKLLYGQDSRSAIMRGVDLLADAVKVTLGPGGRTVVIGRRGMGLTPHTTKDGVTVANNIDPTDPTEQIGSDIVREAAQKTVEACGDGTTTSTVLAQAMCRLGMQQLDLGVSPVALKAGIEKATKTIIKEIEKMTIPVTDEMVFQVANISANGDEAIAKIVAAAVSKVGKDGVITVEESRTLETHLDVVDGLQVHSGYLSPNFITDRNRAQCVFEGDVHILLYEGKIATAKSIVPLLRQIHEAHASLLIIAGDFDNDALAGLCLNKIKAGLPVCAIRSGAFGDRRRELLRDIASLTGGKAITDDLGLKLENILLADLGMASRVVVDTTRTVIVKGAGDDQAIEGRIIEIRNQLEKAEGIDKVHLQQRLAGLAGGVAVIKVGATTEVEMREKKDRVEDATFATKAALEEGIVPGGGIALLRSAMAVDVSSFLPEELPGVHTVLAACEKPLTQIVENAGKKAAEVMEQVRQSSQVIGYNARTGKYEDLVASGVIDPAKVVKEALKNAASVAGMILTTEALVAEIETKEVA